MIHTVKGFNIVNEAEVDSFFFFFFRSSLAFYDTINVETTTESDTCTPMLIAVVFTLARTWKQPRCPWTDEWIRKYGTWTQWNIAKL